MRRVLGVVLVALLALAGVGLLVTGSARPGGSDTAGARGQPRAADPATAAAQPVDPRVEVVASGLEVPWALAFGPEGRLFFTERPGRLRVMEEGKLRPDPLITLPVAASPGTESGLMGLALDPGFQANGHLYVMYSYRDEGGTIRNRISRLTVAGDRAGDEKVLLDGIPGGRIHDGGRLKFGPDGKLYATTGDAAQTALAQDLGSPAGKVLRLNPDGSAPGDNPFPGSPVYSFGHRNPEGLAFQPGSGRLFGTEHGPTGNDEVNLLEAGRNYGWPVVQAAPGDSRFVDPLAVYNPAIAPAGAAFHDGSRFPAWAGNLFFGTLRGEHLHRIVLDGTDSRQVVSEERLFEGVYGRVRDVVQGPDGHLYFTTSNRDGRGRARPGDDRILRLVPR